MRWPEGPPHLALNPPYLFLFFLFFCFFVFFVLFFCWFFFGGFKGQVRWPKGPPHLALNPLYLFCFFWGFLVFLFFLIQKKTLFSPLEKDIFCLFSVFLFLSPLAFFDLPLFLFLFPCLSLFFFYFFIPSCLCFWLSFGSLFWSLSLFFFLLWFSFMKGTTSKYSIASFFFIKIFSLFSFLPFFVSSSFFLSLLFPDFKLGFLFNLKVFHFQTNNLKKNNIFWSKGRLQQNGFLLSTCVLENVKSYRFFFGHFFGNFWLMFKKHYKIRYFSTFLKAEN